jgi:hypothetical protein
MSRKTSNNYERIAEKWATIQKEIDKRAKDDSHGNALSVRAALNLIAEPRGAGEQEVITLTEDQLGVLAWFLKKRGIEADPKGVFETMGALELPLKRIRDRLERMKADMASEEEQDWINSHEEGADVWEQVCHPYGLDPAQIAWAANIVSEDVTHWHSGEERTPDEFAILLYGDMAGGYYFARSRIGPPKLARESAEWLSAHAGESSDLDLEDEELEKLRRGLAETGEQGRTATPRPSVLPPEPLVRPAPASPPEADDLEP